MFSFPIFFCFLLAWIYKVLAWEILVVIDNKKSSKNFVSAILLLTCVFMDKTLKQYECFPYLQVYCTNFLIIHHDKQFLWRATAPRRCLDLLCWCCNQQRISYNLVGFICATVSQWSQLFYIASNNLHFHCLNVPNTLHQIKGSSSPVSSLHQLDGVLLCTLADAGEKSTRKWTNRAF